MAQSYYNVQTRRKGSIRGLILRHQGSPCFSGRAILVAWFARGFTTDGGESRWVPDNWVEREGEYCVLQRPYTATELSVEEGEKVTVLLMESGWGWATNESGQSGWLPLERLAPLR